MIRAEPALHRDGSDVFFGQYKTGRFWHTVRDDDDGKAVPFKTEAEAIESARNQWWSHVSGWARSRVRPL